MRFWRAAACAAILVASVAAGSARGAEPAPAPPAPAGLVVAVPGGTPVAVGPDMLAKLPARKLSISFLTERGTRQASFEGPLLWDVLQQTGAIDPVKHREQVSQTVVITGRDGYRAVLAVGELAPEFEAKEVILADKMDGQTLDANHLRVVVPLDKRGGRSVREVIRIEVVSLRKE